MADPGAFLLSTSPRGPPPILSEWDRRDRLSVISAIKVSPQRRRLGLYFDILVPFPKRCVDIC